ncbi:hypothetical protein C8F04DRAFT_1064053 [Mycena alexandri]|uniref:DUF6534 domain-containing protein n=1 Tax=Mycena alexandri TaxID=1745969 RepID=A0AAD6TGY1_9AGAR|nr:hypothetical protein C8F04DRAFT_1064053 [Mycena alexandri]
MYIPVRLKSLDGHVDTCYVWLRVFASHCLTSMSVPTPTPTLQLPPLGNTLGALFMGMAVSCMLFGLSSLQVYFYYHWYPHDARLHKISVGLIWIMDATITSLMVFTVYHYAVLGFGNYPGLLLVHWSIKLSTLFNVVVILLVQSLYAYRIWRLSGYHHGVLGYVTALVVLGGFAVGIVFAYETFKIHTWFDILSISWAVETAFGAATFIDLVLSAAMCYYLGASKGMGSQLNSRISTLMQYTLSSGVLTSACSAACLFTYIFMHTNLIFVALTFLLTRLYVNSFMAMMNARQRRTGEFDTLSNSRGTNQAVMLSPTQRSAGADPERQLSPMKAYELTEFDVPTLRTPAPPSRGLQQAIREPEAYRQHNG